jgi:hypothetical protein
MTENEAIELLKNNYPKTRKMVDGRLQGGFDDHECDVGIVIDLAINALEEVQQYRAIGTPEELQTMKEHGGFTGVELANIAAMQIKLKEYEAIGTPEEYPTAYDVDKVVEQLGKLKKAEQGRPDDCDEDGCGDGEQIYDGGRSQGRYEAFSKAIEIVKAGGADGN